MQHTPNRMVSHLFSAISALAGVAMLVLGWTTYQRPTVLVEWSTASELGTAGFNLYRSADQAGPYERVNTQLIPSSDDPLTGGQYRYKDRVLRGGQRYYYELEEVEASGATSRYGPVEVEARRGGLLEMGVGLLLLVSGAVLACIRPGSQSRKAEAALCS